MITLITKKLAALSPNLGCKLFVDVFPCTMLFLNFGEAKTWRVIND